jgi:signal transduction histidine kinase
MVGQVEKRLMAELASLKEQLVLQSAQLEQKNRELEIEAGLDKVRVRATDMRYSSELAETSAVLFQQLNKLGINAIRIAVGIFDNANDAMELWTTSYSEKNEVIRVLDYVNMHVHPAFENILAARKQNKSYSLTILKGQEVKQYYENITYSPDIPDQLYNENEFFYAFFFGDEGCLSVVTNQQLADDQCNMMIRFASVFGLLYTRFLDLQKAEAQIREAQIEAALERVRTRTMAMQNSEELVETASLLFNQLRELGESFESIAVGIVNETEAVIDMWATDQGRLRLDQLFKLPLTEPHVINKMYRAWKGQAKALLIDLSGKGLDEYFEFVVKHGASVKREQFGNRYVQKVGVFSKGVLSVIILEPRAFEGLHMQVLERFANVFDLTYTRFLDLKLAEANARKAEDDLFKLHEEKRNTEKALGELKAAQAQLVQSEKMASLGELTASIAHEIQNPLNFVNNFSDLNIELIGEMNEEIEKGNYVEAKNIASYIETNEEKINHHGKRADVIVKGMLQHSRTSTGGKQPTDINALTEEYLRLAYHGLRAKEKSFNTKLELDLDQAIGMINVVPQEIGRVILNLINNAFYAVSEKQKQNIAAYEPGVAVSTKKMVDKILISVRDNGPGIPVKILDKIFQPFFTTKPTGQGTGLGLSLVYDIVKAHGGEIKVETKEAQGTDFIIHLPLLS